jgi:hypothetical protein
MARGFAAELSAPAAIALRIVFGEADPPLAHSAVAPNAFGAVPSGNSGEHPENVRGWFWPLAKTSFIFLA